MGGVALLAALVALWLLWPEPKWTLSVAADTTEVTPWETVNLVATLKPSSVPKQPVTWSWKSDGAVFSKAGSQVTWSRGVVGSSSIEVTATAANGVQHSASLTVRVELRPYLSGDGKMVMPPPDTGAANGDGGSGLPFSIADVWVEKSEVCQGEQSRIRVTAADTRGQEKWLTPNVNGIQSWEVPFVAAPSAPGLRRVPVFLMDSHPGATNRASVESDVYIEVKDCIAPFPIYLEERTIPPDPEDIAFVVHLFNGPEWKKWANSASAGGRATLPTARAASYVWDFGDGTNGTSADPRINHRYPPEEARSGGQATSYTAKVDAMAADGSKMATGYVGLAIPNSHGTMLRDFNILSLLAHVPPGPAPEGEGGSRSVRVTLQNLDSKETASLTGLKSKFVPCDGKEGSERPLSLSSVFGDAVVPPRGTISGRLTVPKEDLEGFCTVVVDVVGKSTPGNYDVAGTFALVTGSDRGQRLTAAQADVLQKARALLGDASVLSQADIQRLEDEGKIPKGILGHDPFAPPPPR